MQIILYCQKGISIMKTAAKVFIIIGMICQFYLILPLIFGFIALSKMKKNELTIGWKVCTLIFVNIIAGILLLCMPAEAPVVVTEVTEEATPEEAKAE